MTGNAARMLRLRDYGMAPGCHADLVLLDAHCVSDAILRQAARLAVFKRGMQVAGQLRVV